MSLITFALICTACYYLLARAAVTRWFWEPADSVPVLGCLLRCPACAGFWIGLVLGHVIPTNGHVHVAAVTIWSCVATSARHAAYGIVLTTIGWALMKVTLGYGRVPDPEEDVAGADRDVAPEEPHAP